MAVGDILRDTGRFDSRTWYVDGYASHWFSSHADAEAAWKLAGQVELNGQREIAGEIKAALDRILP